ncbi:unnamed protein product [Phytomonas sp. Hart1]|nr:unnamed protein product [Phytomonas sp. Hart1]|eukprot:CCW71079.1 unnamed protein product [Phytomonas sp. isolate Hart1]
MKEDETFELLRLLLPYLGLDAVASDSGRRQDQARLALSAVASLAKCADPWVQGLVGAEAAVVERTLSEACHTLITLCKIQGNEDSQAQQGYLRDVLLFWSVIVVASPVVAARLGLLERVERDFAWAALAPLLASSDRVVYAAASLLTATLLDELNSVAPALSAIFGRVLLAAVVDANTGRHCGEIPDFYTYWVSLHDQNCAEGGHDALEYTDSHTSFFNFFILSHLTSIPLPSDEIRTSRDSHKVAFTEWTAMEASLVLIKSLAENLPVVFLKYVLLLDVGTLGEVWKTFNSRRAESDGKESRRVRGWLATTFAPLIEVNVCFSAHLSASNRRVYGITDEQLAQDVLERMLRIESNAPLNYLHQRQVAEGSFFQDFSYYMTNLSEQRKSVPKTQQDTGELSSMTINESDGDSKSTLFKEAPTSKTMADPEKAPNAWFHKGLHQAPLIISLTRILLKLFDFPYRVNILLSQALIAICLLPDLRALYTLMDSEHGRLYHSLRVLRNSIDKLLDGDYKASLVMNNAMATTSDYPLQSKPNRRTSKDGNQGSGIDTKSLSLSSPPKASEFPTLIYLYNIYLDHWDYLTPPTLCDCDDLSDRHALNRPLPASLPEAIGKALIKNKCFLETCTVLEILRLELGAVVGYMALSHSLLNLQPGKIKGVN